MKKILKIKKIIVIVIISIITELILSNITYLNLLYCNIKNDIADYTSIYTEDGTLNLVINTKETQIQNIKIYYKNEKSESKIISYTPVIIVYGLQSNERTLSSKYTSSNTNTKININSENKCLSLTLEINGLLNENEIDKIVINDTHIEFSLLRCFIILVFLLFIYMLKMVNKDIEYDDKNKKQLFILYAIIGVIIIGIFIEMKLNFINSDLYQEDLTYIRDFLNAQVESILNNRSAILLEPSEQLLSLENPYDNSLRQDEVLEPYVDYSLYKGKFYSYFGIAPLILLMLPFKIITGYYLTNVAANFLLLVIMILVFSKLYRMLIKRYIKHISYFNFILGFLTIFFSAIIMYLARGMVYDIEVNSGIIFTMLSYILILSIYNHPKEKVYRKIAMCSICMGLMVLSKPSFIVYYVLLFYLLINLRKKLNVKEFVNCIKIFIILISIIAIFQMWWNYIRFDSIFCFGAKYQLTIFDMENLTYFSPIKILKGIFYYLFTLPVLDITRFPFIFIKNYGWINSELNVITFNKDVFGIFVIPLPWIYCIYSSLKRNLKLPKELRKTISYLIISCIIILIINIRNGVTEAYVTDIKIFLYTFAMILYFKILENTKNSIAQKIFWLICITSILLTIPMNITLGTEYLYNVDTNFDVYLKNIFEFWV